MSEKPRLQLGDPPRGLARQRGSARGLWLIVLLQTVTLGVVVVMLTDAFPGTESDSAAAGEMRAVAISLEERSLAAEAAAAWQEYLRQSPDAPNRSEIHYRIGKLLMDAQDYSGAVTEFVAAEQSAADNENSGLGIGPKIVECLRRLGKYGEVGRELSRQVEVGGEKDGQATVLATFAGEKLTEADLDRMIENTVDRLLALQPDSMSVNREQLLQQYQSQEARQQMLQQILQRELFSRRARELELDRETMFQQTLDFMETDLLASRFLEQELNRIVPTDVDIEAWYSANKEFYSQPATASVVVFPIPSGETAENILGRIESADDFRALARESNDGKDVVPVQIIAGRPDARLGDTDLLFKLNGGEWTKAPLTSGDEQVLVLMVSKSSAQTPSLDQIRLRVEADYRRRKQQELTQKLSADLMQRYKVRILTAADGAFEGADSAPRNNVESKNEDKESTPE